MSLEERMAAKDIYHDEFVRALQKDGWTITHDPLIVPFGRRDLLVDIGAERLVAAERNGERIAVEIKSFIGPSLVQDLKEALGQFVLYSDALADSPSDADRTLYLAVRQETYNDVFGEEAGQKLLQRGRLRLVIFHPTEEVILRWIK
jgi:hypothetical protein